MTYIVREAPDGMSIDTSTPITPELAAKIASTTLMGQPVRGVCQYVGLEDNGAWDINVDRVAGIMAAGLGLWLVQHCLMPGWTATAMLGRQLGNNARRNAMLAGYLSGAHLALDLEGCASVGQPVIDYVNAWCEAVRDDFAPLLYVGYSTGLNAQQLYEAFPAIHCYWSDFGPRQVSTRGFAVKQHTEVSFAGIRVDPDTTQADLLGGRLLWMIDDKAPSERPTNPELDAA